MGDVIDLGKRIPHEASEKSWRVIPKGTEVTQVMMFDRDINESDLPLEIMKTLFAGICPECQKDVLDTLIDQWEGEE